MEKYCSNCGYELKEDADKCLNCGKIISNFNDNPSIKKDFLNNKSKFEITNFFSIGFAILLFLFTIYLVFTRYIHNDDPECLVCGLSILLNFLIVPAFIIFFIISIICLIIRKNKPSINFINFSYNFIYIISIYILFTI